MSDIDWIKDHTGDLESRSTSSLNDKLPRLQLGEALAFHRSIFFRFLTYTYFKVVCALTKLQLYGGRSKSRLSSLNMSGPEDMSVELAVTLLPE